MKTDKHTPGPWAVQAQDLYAPIWVVAPEPDFRFVAKMGSQMGTHDVPQNEDAANARLIAAAPELLAALKKMEDVFSDLMERGESFKATRHEAAYVAILQAYRAIVKATGGNA